MLDKFDTFVFDCDGVLWHGTDPIPGASETLAALKAQGKHLYFVTNTSTSSRGPHMNHLPEQ